MSDCDDDFFFLDDEFEGIADISTKPPGTILEDDMSMIHKNNGYFEDEEDGIMRWHCKCGFKSTCRADIEYHIEEILEERIGQGKGLSMSRKG
ncbi:hypothetical protein ADUPG1_012802 [Aduncisulcus paluster]|uniref:Uncharacterized protein n=1 Tax=Aduncisulcus paluster TaxID=2918883 RepID=A0ABQ5K2D7_9EUKA|nr:hypothetical protein ADUPG1_012693 [Aduncisulcus paluster]GKT24651.1 hypothetical protein ADUPG1_012802 [Aduncisulcus paluster]